MPGRGFRLWLSRSSWPRATETAQVNTDRYCTQEASCIGPPVQKANGHLEARVGVSNGLSPFGHLGTPRTGGILLSFTFSQP